MTLRLEGFFPVTVTPFSESGALMLDCFEELLRWHLDQGAQGLCVGADNGESWALTTEELRQVARTAFKVAGGRVPVLVGAMGPATVSARGAIERAAAAAEEGAAAVLVSPQPYIDTATRDEVVKRYAEIGRAVPVPIVAYNTPRHLNITLDGDTLRNVCDACDVVGLKEASREFMNVTDTIRTFGDRLCVFVGCGWLIMPGIAQGGRGFLSTGPDLLGRDAARIIDLARAAPSEEGRALHQRAGRIYHAMLDLGLGTPPAPVKAALNLLGLPVGVPRSPIEPLSPANVARMRGVLEGLGLEIRSPEPYRDRKAK